MDRGVIYVATGPAYVAEALVSAASVKRHMPDLPITLYTDRSVTSPHVDEVVRFDADGYFSRIPRLASSPYERRLFLDSDTYVCARELTHRLTCWTAFDIAVAHAPLRAIYEVAGVPDGFPEYNAGVILFRPSPKVQAVFAAWAANVRRISGAGPAAGVRWVCPVDRRIWSHDQGALRQALYGSNLRIATLPPEYNCRFSVPGFVDGPVRILHGRGLDLPAVAAAINSTSVRRGYEERAGRLRLKRYLEPSIATFSLANIRYTLRRRGLRWMVHAALRRLSTWLGRRGEGSRCTDNDASGQKAFCVNCISSLGDGASPYRQGAFSSLV